MRVSYYSSILMPLALETSGDQYAFSKVRPCMMNHMTGYLYKVCLIYIRRIS